RQGGPRPAQIQTEDLPTVEAVLVPVVGRERERVAGQPAPERRQLERADGRSFGCNPVDVARAPRPTDGDEEDAPQGGKLDTQVEAELAVEVLTRLVERAVHHLRDFEPQVLHGFPLCAAYQSRSSAIPS